MPISAQPGQALHSPIAGGKLCIPGWLYQGQTTSAPVASRKHLCTGGKPKDNPFPILFKPFKPFKKFKQ